MNKFNQKEFDRLCARFNTDRCIEDITIRYNSSSFFNKVKSSVQRDRRGEVVFCVCRPNGKIIIITCKDYPEGIYRIPTGGVGHGESIIKAVYREVREELGLDVIVKKFGGVLRIRFEHDNDYVMFYSYLFILDEKNGRLLLDASDDEISEVKEVDMEELKTYVNRLDNIAGKWSDWGKFRYATSNAILKQLESKP